MKRILTLLWVSTLVISCDFVKNYNKPNLELSNSTPYTLRISEFDWSYGRIEFNKYSGDFERLDRKVFNLLKGKTGTCTIYMTSKVRNQYGTEKSESQLIGDLDLKELNKYESWEYWHKNAGIKQLLNQKYFPERSQVLNQEAMDSISEMPGKPAIEATQPAMEPGKKEIGRTFHYNSMIGMPWLHYKITEEGLEELQPPDPELFTTISYWEPFIDNIKDLRVTVYGKTANLTVKMPDNVKSFTLLQEDENLFVHEEDPYIALTIVSPIECVIFFKNGDSCVGVRNKSLLDTNTN